MAYSDPASDKQINLVKQLFTDLNPKMETILDADADAPEATQVVDGLAPHQDILTKVFAGHPVTKGEISKPIDALFAADRIINGAVARLGTSTTPGIVGAERIIPNRYDKDCSVCGNNVPEGKGFCGKIMGAWKTFCGHCAVINPETQAKEAAARNAKGLTEARTALNVQVTEGMYRVGGATHPTAGTIYRVQTSQTSGKLYAKRLNAAGDGFVYDSKAMGILRAEGVRLTLEEAKAYGKATGQCCNCARTLTDPKSIEAGIGPICAGRF